MASVYERELKYLLSGDMEFVEGFTKSFQPEVRDSYLKIIQKPFIVIRAAGSFGVDLVAVRNDISFPIEVKTSSKETILFSVDSGRAREQAEWLKEKCMKSGLFPLYAFRLKHLKGKDPWSLFTMEMDGVVGRGRIVYGRLPRFQMTSHMNYAMRWKEGMPLHKFIEYLSL